MSVNCHASLPEVAQRYRIKLQNSDFVAPVSMQVSDQLRADLRFMHTSIAFDCSSEAVCENLIYPILKEVWRHYTDHLSVWSHMPLHYDDDLCGTPDYFIARKSPLGHLVMDKPQLLIVEAKKDDFSRGWGQCLAAMLAAQRIHGDSGTVIFGITTNGRGWEFGRLERDLLLRDPRLLAASSLDDLCAGLNYILDQCRRQVVRPTQAA